MTLELQPVGDSEETLAIWMAHSHAWREGLQARLGEPVEIEWRDPDSEIVTRPRATTLVYERSR